MVIISITFLTRVSTNQHEFIQRWVGDTLSHHIQFNALAPVFLSNIFQIMELSLNLNVSYQFMQEKVFVIPQMCTFE